jgi:hypothetical protein
VSKAVGRQWERHPHFRPPLRARSHGAQREIFLAGERILGPSDIRAASRLAG